MPSPESTPLASSRLEAFSAEGVGPMSGDFIIQRPDVAWDTVVVVPKGVDEVWAGRLGITRMGPLNEGGAGLPTPPRLDRYLLGARLRAFRSLPEDAPFPRQLEVGDSVPDGHKNDRAVIVERDDEARTIVLEMQWSSERETRGLHYTWQLSAEEGEIPGITRLTTRTRMENIKHPELWAKFGPRVDRGAMRLVAEGIMSDDPTFTTEQRGHLIRNVAIGAIVGGIAARELTKHSSLRAVRIAPILGVIIGGAAGTKIGRKRS